MNCKNKYFILTFFLFFFYFILKTETVVLANETSPKFVKNADVNFDFKVDILDIAKTASMYNMKSSETGFSSSCDFNSDGVIDIFDLTIVSKRVNEVVSMPDLNMETYIGNTFNMPTELEARLSSGYLTKIKASWSTTSVNTSSENTYSISGQLVDYKKAVTSSVKVTKSPATYSNIMNFGLVAKYNNKIYYSNPANGLAISSSNLDGSSVVKLCDDAASYLNVFNDWIYYVNLLDNNYIYKIKTDGTGRTIVLKNSAEYINVSDGWIYYSNASDGYKLYKVRVDGTQRTKLNNLVSINVSVHGDYIYFCDYSMYGNLRRIKKDGTGLQDVNDIETHQYVITDTSAFAINNYSLYRTVLSNLGSSSHMAHAIHGAFNSINTDGKDIYLLTDRSIEKFVRSENKMVTLSSTQNGLFLNICGDEMFYYGFDAGGLGLIKASLEDGKGKIFGIDNIITALYPAEDKTYQYDNYFFPDYVDALRLDDSFFPARVQWSSNNFNTNKLGKFNFQGTVASVHEKTQLEVEVAERGNTNPNLSAENKGTFAAKGDFVYYRNPFDKKFYKSNKSGIGRIKLSDDSATYINVVGDYIYYVNETDKNIYKMKTDGSAKVKMNFPDSAVKIIVDKEKIYVGTFEAIYSMNLDGTELETVVELDSFFREMALIGNYIIYSDKGIWISSLDGFFKEKLVEDLKYSHFTTDGRYIYSFSYGESTGIRYDLLTGEQKTISNRDMSVMTIFNNTVYYNAQNAVYRCDFNGENKKLILSGYNGRLYSSEQGLYMEDEAGKKLYYFSFEGTNFKQVGEETNVNLDLLEPQNIYITRGRTYTLPKTVNIPMIDGSTKEMSVVWNSNVVDTSVVGNYTYIGSLSGETATVTLNLFVANNTVMGNSTNNSSNTGFTASYDNWVIYSNKKDGGSLYKITKTGTENTKLNNIESSSINVYGGWIYYNGNHQIRRMKLDGTKDSVVKESVGVLRNLTIVDGWMYYINGGLQLWKARVDGSEESIISDRVMHFFFDGTTIYYSSSWDGMLYKMNIDGTQKVLVSSLNGNKHVLHGDYIYFGCYYNNNHALLRMKKDGSGVTVLQTIACDSLIVHGNYIYTVSSGSGLNRYNLDGTGGTKLASMYSKINIIDNWIYYYNYSDELTRLTM
jgi:hypothetical protein